MGVSVQRIYISGLHSGPNPSPGVGIATSLKAAYPDCELVGVDYSVRSSGIHSPEFDRLWIQRPWPELDLALYARQVRSLLDSGALWISGLDLETLWLSKTIGQHPYLLVPSGQCIAETRKPGITAHEQLSVDVPPFLSTEIPDSEIYSFCRAHNWRVWLKGPFYEARFVSSWQELVSARLELEARWATRNLFVQAHVPGYEESIAFSAYRGNLADVVHMTKRDITSEGKTWAGNVSLPPSSIRDLLANSLAHLQWTGGGELEMVRDFGGKYWLIEWNPRFPAWIHGSTIAGHNLPGRMVELVTQVPAIQQPPASNEFTRIVVEIPTRADFPLFAPTEPVERRFTRHGKHPSGMPSLAERLPDINDPRGEIKEKDVAIDNIITLPLCKAIASKIATPVPVFLDGALKRMIDLTRATVESIRDLRVKFAYSVKTNPDIRILRAIRQEGLLAEAISQSEISHLTSCGFRPGQIVFNGPAKAWSSTSDEPLHAVFCDSIEEFKVTVKRVQEVAWGPGVLGLRIRPPNVESRFGIDLGTFQSFQDMLDLMSGFPNNCGFGLHFHYASSSLGVEDWWALFESVLHCAMAISDCTRVPVECLDLGGGWHPEDFVDFCSYLPDVLHQTKKKMPRLREVIIEPGKAISQNAFALLTSSLEKRVHQNGAVDLVVDGAISELPQVHNYPHRILSFDRSVNQWQLLRGGKDRILGRICMEDDVLASQVEIPATAEPGTPIAFCDAGAYDRSMSYEFGRG